MLSSATVVLVLFATVSCVDLRYLKKEKSMEPEMKDGDSTGSCTVGIWSDWTEELKCNAECGACGKRVLKRTCLTPSCTCVGNSRQEEVCNIHTCDYPKAACCPPYRLIALDGHFACGPQEQNVIDAFLKSAHAVAVRDESGKNHQETTFKKSETSNMDEAKEAHARFMANHEAAVKDAFLKAQEVHKRAVHETMNNQHNHEKALREHQALVQSVQQQKIEAGHYSYADDNILDDGSRVQARKSLLVDPHGDITYHTETVIHH